MSSYDPGGWGHLPKELFASFPPSNMVCICRLYFLYLRALPFHLVFIGKINHVGNPEWNGCHLSFACMCVMR
jgi:hypothetical protein